jgi:hypothetical protein
MISCGDWLALALKDAFRTGDGGFDLTAFKACLKDNGVTLPNVDEVVVSKSLDEKEIGY